MRSFSALCAYLGCPLRNIRWSWSAIAPDSKRALFTIWQDEINEGQFVLYPVSERRPGVISESANVRPGAKEVHRISLYAALNPNMPAFGIRCVAQDENAKTRSRKTFDAQTLLRLQIKRDGEQIVAYIVGEVPVETLAQT